MTEAAVDGLLQSAAAAGHAIVLQGFGRVDTRREEGMSRRLIVFVTEPSRGSWTISVAPADVRRAAAAGEPLPAASGIAYTHDNARLVPAACGARLEGGTCVFAADDPAAAIK
jgi:hypothetical protein